MCPSTTLSDPSPTAWVRYLSDGRVAVGLPNLGDSAKTMDVCFSSLKLGSGKGVSVRDVWQQKDLPTATSHLRMMLREHESEFFVLSPAADK